MGKVTDLWLQLFFYSPLTCFATDLSKGVEQKYLQICAWVDMYKIEGVDE